MTLPKVLASVYACNPEKGSEDGAGWNWIRQVSRFAEIWAVTLPLNKEAIERGLEKTPMPNPVHWVYYDIPQWMRFWHDGKRGERFHYNMWQRMMYDNVAKDLHEEVQFDGTHHLTWGQYWSASYLALLPTTFLWGPVGGGESAPDSFFKTYNARGKIYETMRDFAQSSGENRANVKNDALKAAVALATTEETAERLRALGAKRVEVLPNSAIPNEDFEFLSTFPIRTEKPFRMIGVGRILHWKGTYLGVQAFAKFHKEHPDSEYWIFGDGPDQGRVQQMVNDLGVSDSVKLWGRVPRSRVLEALAECDVLVHPSLHDAAGWTGLEGMSAGLPVICLNLGGPALQVTEETGFKVPANTPEEAIDGMADAMKQLAENPEMRQKMAIAGRKRIKENFLWDHLGNFLSTLPPYNGEK